MDITIMPGKLCGCVTAIPSKSQAHRLLICGAFADGVTELICPETNRDIEATAGCLNALGANIVRKQWGYEIEPVRHIPGKAILNCHDSGSTLRFLLPIAGALGIEAEFLLEGRLGSRPLSPLWEEMERMGCSLFKSGEKLLQCEGKLRAGTYVIDGGVSSQFITGLMLALPLLHGESRIIVTGKQESKPYIDMTRQAMAIYGVEIRDFSIPGGSSFHSPGKFTVEGDWSNGAFFLAANALGSCVTIENLSSDSFQGDKAVTGLLLALRERICISAADIPDLVPILAIAAAGSKGADFTDIRRLRMKESDRVASVVAMINALGGHAVATEDTLTVHGTGLIGGTVDAVNDHRIAMSAAVAATICSKPVTILGAQCVEKSYPQFWEEYRRLGGNYEQHLR